MSNDKQREAFEVWFLSEFERGTDPSTGATHYWPYNERDKEIARRAYDAGRGDALAQRPEPPKRPDNHAENQAWELAWWLFDTCEQDNRVGAQSAVSAICGLVRAAAEQPAPQQGWKVK